MNGKMRSQVVVGLLAAAFLSACGG
ncbi:MAG: hypothetical protein RJA59_89, partial [Pseudomonadota bacterium]